MMPATNVVVESIGGNRDYAVPTNQNEVGMSKLVPEEILPPHLLEQNVKEVGCQELKFDGEVCGREIIPPR